MLTEANMIEAINHYRAGDDDRLLELFQRLVGKHLNAMSGKSIMNRSSLILFNTLWQYCQQHPRQ